MATVYRLKRRRPRVSLRAALAVSGAALAGLVWYGAAAEHMPPPRPAAAQVAAHGPESPAAARSHAGAHQHTLAAAAGRMALYHGAHGLVPHPYWNRGGLGRRLWRRATR